MHFKETFTLKDLSNHLSNNSNFFILNNECISITSFFHDVAYLSKKLHIKFHGEQFLGVKIENTYETLLTIFALWNLDICPVMLSTNLSEKELSQLKNQVPFYKVISNIPKINKNQDKDINFNFLNIKSDAIVIFTSGTSSIPKGVLLTFENIIQSALSTISFFNFKQNNKWILSLPMNHIAGLMIPMRALLGGGSVQVENSDILEWSKINKNSFCSLVPTQLTRALVGHEEKIINNLKCLKLILIGGSKIPLELLSLAREYQLNLSPSYGMSEACSTIAAIPPKDFLLGNDYAATILPSFKLEVTQNIISIASKCTAKGYFSYNKLNQEPFTSTFFKTSDLGEITNDNKLIIKGRTDKIIISGGKNISPKEIEKEINLLPNIKKTFVISFPDNTYGEIAVAFYSSNNNSYSPRKFRKILKENIESYKIPKLFIELPENLHDKHKIPIDEFHKLILKYKAIHES
jgi:o-succinylbenzoate---CoA ligase